MRRRRRRWVGGGRGDRMVLVDAAENPGRLGYQLCGPLPSILSYRAVLRLGGSALHSHNSFEHLLRTSGYK